MFRYYFLLFFVLIVNTLQAQSKKIKNLEKQVYALNNQFKYTESQNLIIQFIKNEANLNEDLVYAHIILSFTYKRLYDYVTTISILKKAKKYAQKSKDKEKLIDIVNAQLAFSLFDIQNYNESLQLMQTLKDKEFKYNSNDNIPKLLMQLAYIDYLDEHYNKSEITYHKAIVLMKKTAPCDLPMIYTKLMMLYNKTNKLDKLQESLNKSLHYADSCNILKYSIYTYEEYNKILKEKDSIKESFEVNKILANLKHKYDISTNLGELHLEREKNLIKDKAEVTEKVSALSVLLNLLMIVLSLVVVLFLLSRKARGKLKKALGFYEEKYNDLWANYQISTEQLRKLKQELSKKSKGEYSNLEILLKDLSIHFQNNINDEHKHINLLKDNFIKALNKKAPYLNSQEQLVLFFMSLQMSQKKIAELLNRTEKSIDSYKYRIKNKIKENHSMSVDEFINSFNAKGVEV